RDDDLVFRIGGDEFALLLRSGDPARASAVLDRLRLGWNARAAERGWPVTLSVGVARCDGNADALVNAADGAMYRAKRSGGDRVLVAEGPHADASPGARVELGARTDL
ncbi:MAG: GGDEF domain-containing protein, partial [Deltaproteobacteria bacterium]